MDVRLEKLRANANLLTQMLEDVKQVADGDPGVKTVHRLRTSTRRCGALLASLTAEGRTTSGSSGKALRKDAARLQRQWKKLRRAAGGVRDLDVHREIAQALRVKKGPAAEAGQEANPAGNRRGAIHGSANQRGEAGLEPLWALLEVWLAKERHKRAVELKAEVDARGQKMTELSAAVVQGLTVRFSRVAGGRRAAQSPALLALEDFAAVSSEMPVLDRENLHDFRKRTKEARYLAEAGGEMQEAMTVARALKRIQDVIGDWHDRDALAEEAERALGKAGRVLTEYLRQLESAEMRRAVLVTERMRGKLLGERQALRGGRGRRRQPGSAVGQTLATMAAVMPKKFPAQPTATEAEKSRSSA